MLAALFLAVLAQLRSDEQPADAALSEPLGNVKNWIRNGLLRLKEGLQTAS